MISKRLVSILICGLSAATWPCAQQIGYHEPKVDTAGRIVPWYGTGPSQAYDHVIRIVFDFWLNMRKCANGSPTICSIKCGRRAPTIRVAWEAIRSPWPSHPGPCSTATSAIPRSRRT